MTTGSGQPADTRARRVGTLLQPVQDLLGPLEVAGPSERLAEVTSEWDDVMVTQPFGLPSSPGALQVLDRYGQLATAERAQLERSGL